MFCLHKIHVKDVVRLEFESLLYGSHYVFEYVLNYVIIRQLGVMSVSGDMVGVQFKTRQ